MHHTQTSSHLVEYIWDKLCKFKAAGLFSRSIHIQLIKLQEIKQSEFYVHLLLLITVSAISALFLRFFLFVLFIVCLFVFQSFYGYGDLFSETWRAFSDYDIIHLKTYDSKRVSFLHCSTN